MAKLTPKQTSFAEEYLIDLNATQAAIRAGYSPKSAEAEASRQLRNVKVKAAVANAIAERSKRTGVSQDRIILELAKIALVNAIDVINMDEATIRGDANREDTAAIASVKVKIIPTGKDGAIIEREVKVYDKIRALELLGKHLGMFKDDRPLGNVNIQIIDNIPNK
ncbi:MAG: terminase small subunit [Actinobacteria bacterium]|nr:terminase small subunit [Actinomycetota bacterium]